MARTAKGIKIRDEGVDITDEIILDFVGAGVSASDSGGGVGTISVSGGGGGGNSFSYNEVASGSGTSFTIAHAPIANLYTVFGRGQRLLKTTDYSISGTTITTVDTWTAGDITIDYQY